ncbi:MAG: hypothetical protein ACP6IP_05725 [Candidatus Njordarchaeia archaeon]
MRRIDTGLEQLRDIIVKEKELKKIGEKTIGDLKIIYYLVDLGDGEVELIVRMHPSKKFDKELFQLFLTSEIFPYEVLKIYEMGEDTQPRTFQFSKKTSKELLELEKSKTENKIRRAIESMNDPKKRTLLIAAKRKLDELKKNPEKNKREIDLLIMKINEILFYL